MHAFLCGRLPQGDACKDALGAMIKHKIPFVFSVEAGDVLLFVKREEEECTLSSSGGTYAFLCGRVPQGDALKDALDAMIKHNIPFVLSIEPGDIVSFVKKDPEGNGSAKVAHPVNSNDQPISTGEPIRQSFTPGNPNTNKLEYNQAQVASVTNALEMSQSSSFSFRSQTGNTKIQNAFLSSSGTSVFDCEQQEAPIFTTPTNRFRSDKVIQDTHPLPIHPVESNGPDDSAVRESVVKEKFEQSNAAKQFNSRSIFPEASPRTRMTRCFYRKIQAKDAVAESRPTAASGSSVFENSQQQILRSTASNELFLAGNVVVESPFQQSDYEMDPVDPFAPETVVQEESEHSSPVNQVPPLFSASSSAPIDQDEPNDIFQDIKPQHIDLDQPRVVIADIDLTKDFDMIKKEDLDEDLDEEMEEETQDEVGDEADSSDAGEHLDAVGKAYIPKGSSKKRTCDECQKEFYDASCLRTHRRIHSGEKPYQCDVCKKRFRVKQFLTDHSRIHTGERPYNCDVCQKTFSTSVVRKRHMRIHTGERPYSCETCGSRFTQKTALNYHTRTHTGEKPYECKDCEKKFRLSSHLKRHRIRYHS